MSNNFYNNSKRNAAFSFFIPSHIVCSNFVTNKNLENTKVSPLREPKKFRLSLSLRGTTKNEFGAPPAPAAEERVGVSSSHSSAAYKLDNGTKNFKKFGALFLHQILRSKNFSFNSLP